MLVAKERYHNAGPELEKRDYLANLRHSSVFGCRTFLGRKPSLLVLGDSHNYAAWDYNLLQRGFPNDVISSCTMGGWYLETLFLIFDLMDQKKFYPKKIIYGASPRQFAQMEDKEEALSVHKEYLRNEYSAKDFAKDLFVHIKTKQKPTLLHTSFLNEENGIRDNESGILGLDSANVANYFEKYPTKAQNEWRRVIEKWVFTSDLKQKISKICHFVKTHSLDLVVVHIPESPYLESLYGDSIWNEYNSTLEQFKKCGQVIAERASKWEIDNRFFVNRTMDPNFPYHDISNANPISSDDTANYSYDLDHLNFIGAKVFTRNFLMFNKIGTLSLTN
ncbi:MAG: hypothetical protein HYW48_03520 [Deltaproteobacteria bacterium]|nr:hypothetical protein [Deltaproteobacteria bacterium]